jgi:hypothetical protein
MSFELAKHAARSVTEYVGGGKDATGEHGDTDLDVSRVVVERVLLESTDDDRVASKEKSSNIVGEIEFMVAM